MDPRHAYDDLIRRVKEARLLESCGAVLGWDERTYMPHEGSPHRAEQIEVHRSDEQLEHLVGGRSRGVQRAMGR